VLRKNEVRLILRGNDKSLTRTLRRAGSRIAVFGKRSIRRLRKVGNVLKRSFGGVGLLAGVYVLYRVGKAVLDLDTRLARLVTQANKPLKAMDSLRDSLFAIGKATHQQPGDLLSSVEAIVERTGNFDFAVESLRQMGIVATASGAELENVGATASNLMEKMGIKPTGIITVFDILAAQGKKGAFTLQNMAGMFERLLSSASRVGIKGVDGIRKFGAFLQIARRGVGNTEQATTAVERVISNLIAKSGELEAASPGLLFRIDESGKEQFRDFDKILKDIIEKTSTLGKKQQGITLQKIFGERGIRAITPLVQSFEKFGDFREFDKFIEYGGDGIKIMEDFNKISSTTGKKAEDLGIKLQEIIKNIFTTERIKTIGQMIDKLNKLLDVVNKGGWHKVPETIAFYAQGKANKLEDYLKREVLPHHLYTAPMGSVWAPAFQPWLSKFSGFEEKETAPPIENTINLEVKIDQDRGRIFTKVDNMHTKVNVKPLPRGNLRQ